ncbi:MAG: metal-dependent hydrolase [Acidobacteria bacterium]|nr:MAG: metal-dependent hydrolase [Acidobacteriota bacterium]
MCYKILLEPITHFLTGAVLARAGFNRKTALATATMTLAAEAPDLDVFWGFKGPVYNFAHHRGFTHSFLGLIFVSAVVTGLMYLIWLLRGRKTNIPDLPPRWGLLFLFAYIAGLSHILLDFTNNYGVRPFWPFWEKWYSWDIVFIFEPALHIILIGGLALPLIFSFSRRESSLQGRKFAVAALICVALLYAFRDHEHRHAVNALRQQQFQSAPPLRVSVYPYYWNLYNWYAVAETATSFATSDVNSRTGQLNQSELEYFPKPPETPATLAAKRSYLGRAYLSWAQYPLVTETESGEDAIVQFRDLRYDYPQLRGRITLSCSVELNKDLQVVREFFGRREQVPPAK